MGGLVSLRQKHLDIGSIADGLPFVPTNQKSSRGPGRRTTGMDPLEKLISLRRDERESRGLLHTPQEIALQSTLWPSTFELVRQNAAQLQRFLERAGVSSSQEQRPTIYLVGAGTSDYIGQCLQNVLRTEWGCEVKPVPSTTLLSDFTENIVEARKYLWISFSRSGDSPEGVAALERALEEHPGIFHLVVSCNAPGKMTRIAQGRENCLSLVLKEETNDKGLAMTSSFTNMLLTGYALAHVWDLDRFGPILTELCESAQSFLPVAAQAAYELSREAYTRVCFVGTGALAGVAPECALKLLELTAGKTKTMSETTLGLRHGPMAALDKETLFVLFLSTDTTRRSYELDLFGEIEEKNLVGASFAVNGAGQCDITGLRSTRLLAPSRKPVVPDLYRPVIDVLLGQCMGLFGSLYYGLTPDSPSPNGAISRVVQPITIY